jgi:hypothetical protein
MDACWLKRSFFYGYADKARLIVNGQSRISANRPTGVSRVLGRSKRSCFSLTARRLGPAAGKSGRKLIITRLLCKPLILNIHYMMLISMLLGKIHHPN